MIQMPKEEAIEGKRALQTMITYIEGVASDKNMSREVIDYLRNEAKNATPEDVEIIMAWMFVGAVADRAMSRVQANEMVKEIAGIISMMVVDEDDRFKEA